MPTQRDDEAEQLEIRYAAVAGSDYVFRINDSTFIPNDPLNLDWVSYQKWLAEGHKLESSDAVGG